MSFSEDLFVLAKCVDPDETARFMAFYLGLHYLPNYAFRSLWYTKRLRHRINDKK